MQADADTFSSLVTPLPSIAPVAEPVTSGCGFAGWVSNNKFLAAALVVAGLILFRR